MVFLAVTWLEVGGVGPHWFAATAGVGTSLIEIAFTVGFRDCLKDDVTMEHA